MGVLLVYGSPANSRYTKIYKMPRLTDTETYLTPLKEFTSNVNILNDINDNGIIIRGNYYDSAYNVLTDPLKPSNYQFNQYSMPNGLYIDSLTRIWKLNPNMNFWVSNNSGYIKRFFLDFNNYSITNIIDIDGQNNYPLEIQLNNRNTNDWFYQSHYNVFKRFGAHYSIISNSNYYAIAIINNICSDYDYLNVLVLSYINDYVFVAPTSVTRAYNFNSYPSFPGYSPNKIEFNRIIHVELSPTAGSNDNIVYYFGTILQYNSSINKYLSIPAIFKFTYGATNLSFTQDTNMWIYPEYAAISSQTNIYQTYSQSNNAHYYKKYDGNIYIAINKYFNNNQEAYVGIFNPITYQFKMFRLENMQFISNMSIYPNIDESIYTYLPSRASII